MSDSVNVLFHSPSACEISPMVYLHWGASSLTDDIKSALPRMRTGDVEYACAHFVGCCHEQIEGYRSLGCANLYPPLPDENEPPEDIYARIMSAIPDDIAKVDVDEWTLFWHGEETQLPAATAAPADL